MMKYTLKTKEICPVTKDERDVLDIYLDDYRLVAEFDKGYEKEAEICVNALNRIREE